jgi:hypothetical protein
MILYFCSLIIWIILKMIIIVNKNNENVLEPFELLLSAISIFSKAVLLIIIKIVIFRIGNFLLKIF